MTVKLKGSCPPMNEVLELGRECGLVYGLMWESAFKDSDGEFGGTTSWSVKGLTNKCSMSRTTAIQALKKLMDAGFIQHLYDRGSGKGSNVKVWRVTHPKHLEDVRYAIEMMGKPSERYGEAKVGMKCDEERSDD